MARFRENTDSNVKMKQPEEQNEKSSRHWCKFPIIV
jgi:hypothetical protein